MSAKYHPFFCGAIALVLCGCGTAGNGSVRPLTAGSGGVPEHASPRPAAVRGHVASSRPLALRPQRSAAPGELHEEVELAAAESYSSAGMAWLGLDVRTQEGQLFVARVYRHSPAFDGGLQVGDTLLAVDGRALVNVADWRAARHRLRPQQSAALALKRGGQMRLMRLEPVLRPSLHARLRAHYVGQRAPSISSLVTVQGELVPSLSRLTGRVVVLEFWASWCSPCRALTPHLNEWARSEAATGLSVMAVTLDPFEEASISARQLGLKYPLFFDASNEVSDAYNAYSLPVVFAIGKAGLIREVMLGFDEERLERFELIVQALLRE